MLFMKRSEVRPGSEVRECAWQNGRCYTISIQTVFSLPFSTRKYSSQKGLVLPCFSENREEISFDLIKFLTCLWQLWKCRQVKSLSALWALLMPKCLALPAVSFNYSLFFIHFLHTGALRKQGSCAVAKSVSVCGWWWSWWGWGVD